MTCIFRNRPKVFWFARNRAPVPWLEGNTPVLLSSIFVYKCLVVSCYTDDWKVTEQVKPKTEHLTGFEPGSRGFRGKSVSHLTNRSDADEAERPTFQRNERRWGWGTKSFNFSEQKPCHLEERLQKRMFLNFRQTLRPGRATGESQTIQVTWMTSGQLPFATPCMSDSP